MFYRRTQLRAAIPHYNACISFTVVITEGHSLMFFFHATYCNADRNSMWHRGSQVITGTTMPGSSCSNVRIMHSHMIILTLEFQQQSSFVSKTFIFTEFRSLGSYIFNNKVYLQETVIFITLFGIYLNYLLDVKKR